MSTPCRFDDKEYTNWIKCSRALILFKEGLHDFIKTEVTNFHAHIQQNICGSSAGSHCGSCTWKNIKYTGGQHGAWSINCQNKICDKWLYQILLEHNDPQNRSINWKNADISRWPTDGYEVAKVYMPKGQDKTKNLPNDFDAPAVLSLLKYCAWFTKQIQTTSILSDLIDLRNEVMHSGDLRVTDSKTNSCIDKMIQLMSELNIHGDVCTELQKTKTEDIDINFRETEVRALHSLVSSIKEKMDSLQDAQTQQMHDIEEVKGNTMDTEGKVVSMEIDIEGVKLEVEQLTESYQKIKSFLANNPDIHDKNISENIQAIEKSVIALESKFAKKHEEIERKITSVERDMRRTTKGIKRKLKETENNTEVKHQERDAKITSLGKNISRIKKGMKRKFKETEDKHQEIETKITSMGKDISGIKKGIKRTFKETEEKKKEMETKITSMGKNISGIKKGIKRKFKETGEKHQEIETKITVLGRNVRGIKKEIKRKYTRKPNIQKEMSEAPKKKRPETDGLRQLKNQTEDKLDTLRCLKCIPTKQAEEAKKLLKGKRLVVIRGNPGEGKTTTALHLIDNEMYKDKRVVLYSPHDWMKVDTEWIDIVVLEDIFGQFDLDSGRLQEWNIHLPTIKEHVDAEKLQVIITTRDDILSKAYSELGSLKLFSDDLTLTLSSKLLLNSEKMSILSRELQRHKKNMNEDEKEKCIANFTGCVGFPQCCLLFAGDNTLFDRGPEFFRSPSKFFFTNITKLEATRFLSLAFIFCNGTILEENLSPETMPETSKDLLAELASNLRILEKNASITLLRDAYDSFLELYVVKSMSYDFSLNSCKPCIKFTHATVSEAVGQVLGSRCLEMVVKYGNSEYLYQRTYTAKAKVGNSQNVFIPVSVYGLLAQRMVRDVIKGSLIQSVVKHSSLKQHDYLKKLKSELQKGNGIKEFFLSGDSIWRYREDTSEGQCNTFMEYILQCDEEVVRLVYRELLEFLECAHNNNSSDCWMCKHKQKLLELSLYYHHFGIADELIHMNACCTHVCLCNAAKHGDLVMVQTILEGLKRSQVFNPECEEAQHAFCRACISGNQGLIEFMIQEGIIADSRQVVHVIHYGDLVVLKKVVEHLKSRNKWNPHWETYSTHQNFYSFFYHFADLLLPFHATNKIPYLMSEENKIPYSNSLLFTYCAEKFDMADYLLKNGVNASLSMLPALTEYCCSKNVVVRVMKDLKDSEIWYPKCHSVSTALKNAYRKNKYDVCDVLVQEGVSLTMKNFPCLVYTFEHIAKAIQNFKDTDSWDPKCNHACKALENAYLEHKYDVCDLLIQEGVSLTMKHLLNIINSESYASLESIKKAIQNLKESGNWDPKWYDVIEDIDCDYELLDDVFDLLIQEGILLTMKDLPSVVARGSLKSIKKAIQNLKDNGNWDPKCYDSIKDIDYYDIFYDDYELWDDVFDLLIQEGILLTMKDLPSVVARGSLESIKKAIQNLKDNGNWDPKCYDSVKDIGCYDIFYDDYELCNDVFDLLIQEGILLTVKDLPNVVARGSLKSIKKAIQNLKDNGNWDHKCYDSIKDIDYYDIFYDDYELWDDVFDLLIQEGILLTMKDLPSVVARGSLKSIKKAIQNLKDNGNWDPKCYDSIKDIDNYDIFYDDYELWDDVFDLLIQEGILLTMKDLPSVVARGSLESIKKAIQNLKDNGNWDPKCYDSVKDIDNYDIFYDDYELCNDVFDLLIQEGILLTVKDLPNVVASRSMESIKKAIQNLKDTGNWDPKCDDASKALENSYVHSKYPVCNLLVQEGVSLPMKHLPSIVVRGPFESIKKAIQNLKDTGNWDPKCDDASKALEYSYGVIKYDVYKLLVQEGVSQTMKHLPSMVSFASFESIKITIQNLKDSGNWDPKCGHASKALENSYGHSKYDVCDLLVQEGVSLPMKHLPSMVVRGPFEAIKKAIQNLKDSGNWDPKCGHASKALENSYGHSKYDVCDLLVQEGVSLPMKHLPSMVVKGPFESIKKAIQNLKDNGNWDPKCDDASEALENSYVHSKYDVCGLLVQEGVSQTMKHLPSMVVKGPFESIKKAIQNLNDSGNWDPKCGHASKALENSYGHSKYDVCDLLVQEGVSLPMKHLPSMVVRGPFESIKKAIQNLKDNGNWDPKCDDASEALENSYGHSKYDVCGLLVQEGVSLPMKHLPSMVVKGPFESIKKAIQNLKDTSNWDPKCNDAFKALKISFGKVRYDVCDLLVQEGILLTMKTLSSVVSSASFMYIKRTIQHLIDAENWDPECDDAYKAFLNAYSQKKDDVCHLLVQKGISLTMKNLPHVLCKCKFKYIKKAIQYLKDAKRWDPECDDASEALENSYKYQKYDVCDLLVQEGVSFAMKNHPLPVYSINFDSH